MYHHLQVMVNRGIIIKNEGSKRMELLQLKKFSHAAQSGNFTETA